jgi:FixJ family two-component response regulator
MYRHDKTVLVIAPSANRHLAFVTARLSRWFQVATLPTVLSAEKTLCDCVGVIIAALSGADVSTELGHARRIYDETPILVISQCIDHGLLRSAFESNAHCLSAPLGAEQLTTFTERMLLACSAAGPRFRRVIRDLARRHALTSKETDFLTAALYGMSRKEYASINQISLNTCKTRARTTLQKIGALSVGEVRDVLLNSLGDAAAERRSQDGSHKGK